MQLVSVPAPTTLSSPIFPPLLFGPGKCGVQRVIQKRQRILRGMRYRQRVLESHAIASIHQSETSGGRAMHWIGLNIVADRSWAWLRSSMTLRDLEEVAAGIERLC